MLCRTASLMLIAIITCWSFPLAADAPLQFGFGKADITPKKPLRLSGYGSRSEPSEGVDEPLFVRATALMVVLPNFEPRMFLQTVVEQLLLKFMFLLRAHLATWPLVQV